MAYPKNDQTCPTVYVMKTQQDYWQEAHDQVMEEMRFRDQLPMNTITCMAGGAEMLRVSTDGFWVRGKKVEQDDNEAQVVYNAFKSWMSWAQLNRDYK
jgi:hypothetical protein